MRAASQSRKVKEKTPFRLLISASPSLPIGLVGTMAEMRSIGNATRSRPERPRERRA